MSGHAQAAVSSQLPYIMRRQRSASHTLHQELPKSTLSIKNFQTGPWPDVSGENVSYEGCGTEDLSGECPADRALAGFDPRCLETILQFFTSSLRPLRYCSDQFSSSTVVNLPWMPVRRLLRVVFGIPTYVLWFQPRLWEHKVVHSSSDIPNLHYGALQYVCKDLG
ncbi:hypothetical protein FHG87_023478 [Trinorchestia longiramus]|nr:hypothetical protein FHG87_023478 [Trinorchestia longiramus]